MANTTVAKPTYLELISQDEKAVKIEGLKIEAQRASIGVQTVVLELNGKISLAKIALSAAQKRVPYSVQAEFEAVQSLESLEAKLAFAKTIKDERFSDVTI
jgi:hypothetical protein